MAFANARVAVVIPCYRVKAHILALLSKIPSTADVIYVVDDACPDQSGDYVKNNCHDTRIRVVRHESNLGVGGAVLTGYSHAINDGMDIIVKMDGDGQMDPSLIDDFVSPIALGKADYTKGNRFYDYERVKSMPFVRILGNACLSFMAKASSGYWELFDPTNGYTAIHADVARRLPFDKISKRYFFETDILFRLNTFRSVVIDIPMSAVYADEVSGLRIKSIFFEFLAKHFRNIFKRLIYNYYLRDFSIASLELPIGLTLFTFGVVFGLWQWASSWQAGIETPAGTVMLAALPLIVGLQLILAFLAYDISSVPRRPIHRPIRQPQGLGDA